VIRRFLMSLHMSAADRVMLGAEWIAEDNYDLCSCVLESRDDRYCWKCFGFRAVPPTYVMQLIEDMDPAERASLGRQCIAELGFSQCECMTEHGPDRTCKLCNGTGAIGGSTDGDDHVG
jgi:hypothetical protein